MVDSTADSPRTPRRPSTAAAPASEVQMARVAVQAGLLVALPVVAIAGLARGLPGALTALGSVTTVAAIFALTARVQAWAADRGPEVALPVVLGGFVLRLVLYGVAMVTLRPVEAIDGEVLAISAAIAVVAVLALEVRFVLARKELWWVDPRPLTASGDGKKERA